METDIQTTDKPRLLYFSAVDWAFCLHRIPHALAAQEAGFEVVVVCRETDQGDRIRDLGFRLIPVPLSRRSKNPLRELIAIAALVRIYAREKPDIVQHVAVKPALYGSLAAMVTGVPRVVNSLGGLGYIFISKDWTARLLRPFISAAYRFFLNRAGATLVLQNRDDMATLVEAGIIREEKVVIIRGSGVDIHEYAPTREPDLVKNEAPLAVLTARMLRDKGIFELVEAARLLKEKGVKLNIALVGDPDNDNPASIPVSQLIKWSDEGLVEYWGHRDHISEVLSHCHIVVLPSYREGLPKSLLEAAACGRPIVASDVPGCREIVIDGQNGFLVPVGQSRGLADALERLALDGELRRSMGAAGRRLVEENFSEKEISGQTVALYKRLMKSQ